MKTANEIKNALDNIRYYNQRIYTLAKEQFGLDASLNDINSKVGSIRFDALGAIGAGSSWIDVYCQNIEVNLETAVKQDKVLQSEEEQSDF